MRRMVKYLFVGLLILSGGEIFAQETIELSLEESILYSLENNVEAKNAFLETVAAKAVIGERRSEGLPQINGNISANHNVVVPISPFPAIFFDPEAPADEFIGVRFAPAYTANMSATVTQMIFNGSYFIGLRAAKTYRQLAEFDRQFTEIEVVENVKKAYYAVMVNQEREALVGANLNRVESLLNETQVLFEEGFAEKIDVSRIKVQYNNLKTESERARTATEVSKQLLKLQMGLPIQYEVRLTDRLTVMENDLEIELLLQEEGQRRIELDQVQTTYDLAKLDLRNTQILYLPRLDANYMHQRNTFGQSLGSIFSNEWFTGAVLGVTLQIPIFDGLQKSYQVQQNRVQMKQLENQKEFLQENIEYQRIQAKANLKNSLNTLEVQRENRELAEEVFNIARIKFQEGVGSNLEVVDADAALKEAETNYYSALFDALIAKVDLEKALGILK
jgi:outer membrane protein